MQLLKNYYKKQYVGLHGAVLIELGVVPWPIFSSEYIGQFISALKNLSHRRTLLSFTNAEAWRLFAATGITHLVSISGLHVGLIAALASVCAGGWLRLRPPTRLTPRTCRVAVALVAAAGYALLAGWSVPTRRTLFLLAVGGGLLVWRRSLPPLQVWALALAAVLLFDPFAVFFPGLWLSFGLVAALMLPALGHCRPPGRWQALALAQWSATVWSLPLLAWFFSALPPVSPLANALAIPWVSLLLTPLALAGAVLPFDAPLRLAGWLAEGLFRGTALLAAVPVWIVPAPSLPVLGAALVGAAWLTLPAGVPGRTIGALLLAPLLWGNSGRPPPGEAQVTVIDVGQGLAVLVRTARHALLYDTGAPATGATVVRQLAGAGIRRLDLLVLSHHDADHDGAAALLLSAVPVTSLLAGQPGSIPAGAKGGACAAGMHWRWDDVAFDMLAPLPEPGATGDNAASCVLRIAAAGGSLLLTGDIPRAVEERLVARWGSSLASTVLLVPHHGSRGSSSAALLRAVRPAHAVVSAGYRNRYRHPHPAVLADYRAQGIVLWRTDLDGAVELSVGRTVTLAGYRHAAARYWRSPSFS